MNEFKRYNRWTGWSVFLFASLVYLMTMEPVASLWDCSEFIATSYKLEVGHPPGAPLFMMIARLFTMLAPSPAYVAIMVNAMSSLASGFTILFLFWTITHLGRRIYTAGGRELTRPATWTILAAGVVGAVGYALTDTFWFSAVEGEVYALSSLFTALVVWAMLRWEDVADEPHANRWLVLIAYLMGLSIGVHILNLLTIPALVYIYYFRKYPRTTTRGVIGATLIAGAILWLINGLVIPYTVAVGAWFDRLFVNGLGLPVNSGIVFFVLVLFAALGWGVWATYRRGRVVLNSVLLAVTVILLGYSSYASVTIRAEANPPMNSNNPNNPYALLSLLNREQYGNKPLLYGAYYSAPPMDYQSRDVYFLNEKGKYEKAQMLSGYVYPPGLEHLFPRMWNPAKSSAEYEAWAAYRTRRDFMRDDRGELVRDESGRPVPTEVSDFGRKVSIPLGDGRYHEIVEPTYGENVRFFLNYQLGYMYWRYFMWNFVGRQNDIQASRSTLTDGNWLSGIRPVDEMLLGPQDNLPSELARNHGRNTYFFLPFLLGLLGLIYQLNRDQKNFTVVLWLFVMMGVALVVYFNTQPSEPRERDYVYSGSFYAFAIWMGLGVMALRDGLARLMRRPQGWAPVAIASVLSLSVPIVLGAQNWDDHDRSRRYMARDIGWNTLQSALPNAIVLNYGDNDTFPLWNNQEVEGVRPDIKVMNMSYLGGDWYIDQMRIRSNDAPPVPFSLPPSKYRNRNDQLRIIERFDHPVELAAAIGVVADDSRRSQYQEYEGGPWLDYLPARRLALPVNRENALRSGIVAEKDADRMVDTLYINLPEKRNYLDKSELMLLDLLAHFEWNRPIYFTQVYALSKLGLDEYLQFDGFAYRLVPIRTPVRSAWEVGRVDSEWLYPRLTEIFRYGNLADPRVYVDSYLQYNLNVSHARSGFARLAKQLVAEGKKEQAVEVLDEGIRKLPFTQFRYTDMSTIPLVEAYYFAGATEKGDALLRDYARVLHEYIDYYSRFEGAKGAMVRPVLEEYLAIFDQLYYTAIYFKRFERVAEFNDYYRAIGFEEQELMPVPDDSTREGA